MRKINWLNVFRSTFIGHPVQGGLGAMVLGTMGIILWLIFKVELIVPIFSAIAWVALWFYHGVKPKIWNTIIYVLVTIFMYWLATIG